METVSDKMFLKLQYFKMEDLNFTRYVKIILKVESNLNRRIITYYYYEWEIIFAKSQGAFIMVLSVTPLWWT